MSQIKSKDTKIEVLVRSALHRKGHRFKKHVKSLPGKPDVVFQKQKVAVFIDGDFWHGRLFKKWRGKLTPYWQRRIETNIARDKRNFRKLRRNGWTVVRIWEKATKKNLEKSLLKIELALHKKLL